MSDVITTSGRSLGTVTAEIVAISNQAAQMAYMSMVEIGRRLVEAKGLVAHGEWGPWLKNEVKFSQRTANNFMAIYERSENGNSQTFANLGYSQIVQLLALPEGEAEEFAETHDVQNMSVRELKEAIRERDEEKKLREDAQAALKRAEDANARMQTNVNRAMDAENKLSRRVKELQEQLADAEKARADAMETARQFREKTEITEEMKASILAEHEAQADAQREQLEKQLKEALESLAFAKKDRADKEAAAKAAAAKSVDARKAEVFADRDVVAFDMMGKQVLEDLNRMEGYRIKIEAKNPDMGPKLLAAMGRLATMVQQRVEALK